MMVNWSARATERAEEIALFIAQDNLDAAIRWTVGLFDAVEQLGTFPHSGNVTSEPQAPWVRELTFGAYRVFYQVENDGEVLSVRRGSERISKEDLSGD